MPFLSHIVSLFDFLPESDPSEEPLFRIISSKGADKASIEPPPGSQAQPPPKSSHHKKTGRPPARRGRVGRNQYTRDRDRPDIPKNAQGSNSPVHSNSSKEGHNALKVNGEIRKQSKIRQINPNRATMNDMKRRVVGILEFIGRTQVEMAAEVPLVPASKSPRSAKEMATAQKAITQPDDEQNAKDSKGSQHEEHHQSMVAAVNARLDLDEFQRLGSLEMMEVLTRKLMKWQGEFGKLGDK